MEKRDPYFYRLSRAQTTCYVENGGIQQQIEGEETVGSCSFCIVDDNGQTRICPVNNFRVWYDPETGDAEKIIWNERCLQMKIVFRAY